MAGEQENVQVHTFPVKFDSSQLNETFWPIFSIGIEGYYVQFTYAECLADHTGLVRNDVAILIC